MSVRDNLDIVNKSFKSAYGGVTGEDGVIEHYIEVAHSYPLVARYYSGTSNTYGSTFPHVGPVIFIAELEQNFVENTNISFDYKYAEFSGWVTGSVKGVTGYHRKVYQTGEFMTGSATITIPSGTRSGKQFFYSNNPNIHEITNLEVIETETNKNVYLQSINAYILRDNGSKIMHGSNTEFERDNVYDLTESYYIAPRVCKLCDGTGKFQGETCPHCSGKKYIGYPSPKKMLEQIAKDYNEEKRVDSYKELQHRLWAKKQWTFPNEEGVKKYIETVAGINENDISITQSTGLRELTFTVTFPYAAGGTYFLDSDESVSRDFVLEDKETLQNVLDLIAPIGTNAIANPVYLLQDKSEMNYSLSGYSTTLSPSIVDGLSFWGKSWSNTGALVNSGWITSGYQDYSGFSTAMFFNPYSYYDSNDEAYSGITSGELHEIYMHDSTWGVTGNQGTWDTGNFISGFITGVEFYYEEWK